MFKWKGWIVITQDQLTFNKKINRFEPQKWAYSYYELWNYDLTIFLFFAVWVRFPSDSFNLALL